MSEETEALIERVLADHQWRGITGGCATSTCRWRAPSTNEDASAYETELAEHRSHVAAAIAEALAEHAKRAGHATPTGSSGA